MDQIRVCLRHAGTESNLECGKCGCLVCPKCMVHTPVGVRCPECSAPKKFPAFEISYIVLIKAALAGIFAAVILGLVFGLISTILFKIPFIPWIALLGLGYVVGEVVSIAANRRQSRQISAIALVSLLVSFIMIALINPNLNNNILVILALFASGYITYSRVR